MKKQILSILTLALISGIAQAEYKVIIPLEVSSNGGVGSLGNGSLPVGSIKIKPSITEPVIPEPEPEPLTREQICSNTGTTYNGYLLNNNPSISVSSAQYSVNPTTSAETCLIRLNAPKADGLACVSIKGENYSGLITTSLNSIAINDKISNTPIIFSYYGECDSKAADICDNTVRIYDDFLDANYPDTYATKSSNTSSSCNISINIPIQKTSSCGSDNSYFSSINTALSGLNIPTQLSNTTKTPKNYGSCE
ncbi:hypothetical protein [Pseudomonas aeruginosa]|uniref:hypothetical protein n=1 Tax=Pseudomonas aeruginosa TaxID=287 RepID=UPI002E2B2B69|nr:hypothetical protein [Pseudomonas aeruginosa]